MFLDRLLRTASTGNLNNALLLADAARRIYQEALSEGLPLAYIAEQSGRPQYWFANSVVHVVEVLGKRPDEESHIALTRDVIAGVKLADDMLVLVHAETDATQFADLLVTKEQFERYMAWARTVY